MATPPVACMEWKLTMASECSKQAEQATWTKVALICSTPLCLHGGGGSTSCQLHVLKTCRLAAGRTTLRRDWVMERPAGCRS